MTDSDAAILARFERAKLHAFPYALVGDEVLAKLTLAIFAVATGERTDVQLPPFSTALAGPTEAESGVWAEDGATFFLRGRRATRSVPTTWRSMPPPAPPGFSPARSRRRSSSFRRRGWSRGRRSMCWATAT